MNQSRFSARAPRPSLTAEAALEGLAEAAGLIDLDGPVFIGDGPHLMTYCPHCRGWIEGPAIDGQVITRAAGLEAKAALALCSQCRRVIGLGDVFTRPVPPAASALGLADPPAAELGLEPAP